MNFQTLESKLNTHSIEELEIQDPNTFGVVINKLLNMAMTGEAKAKKCIEHFALSLSNYDISHKGFNRGASTVVFYPKKNMWRGRIFLNGRQIDVKSSKFKSVVDEAVHEYCVNHGIIIYNK